MRREDFTGRRFGRLSVLEYSGGKHWKCRCDCGAAVSAPSHGLKSGRWKSCGCLKTDRFTKHGQSKHALYPSWVSIRNRCLNPKSQQYARYGGRGIKLYEPWANDFSAFAAYVGPKVSPSHTIDRINNDGKRYS